jgi:hypothetical protein
MEWIYPHLPWQIFQRLGSRFLGSYQALVVEEFLPWFLLILL